MTEKKDLKVVKTWGEAEIEQHAGRVGGKRNLKEIEIETEDGYLFSYLVKRPGRSVIQAVAEVEKKGDLTGVQNLLLGCVLAGDKDAYENDGAVYSQLLGCITSLVQEAESRLKKI